MVHLFLITINPFWIAVHPGVYGYQNQVYDYHDPPFIIDTGEIKPIDREAGRGNGKTCLFRPSVTMEND